MFAGANPRHDSKGRVCTLCTLFPRNCDVLLRKCADLNPKPVPAFSFRDHFAGTTVSLSHIPWSPDEQAALPQVTRPLRLMKAAAWFLGRRWPAAGRQRLLQQPLPPLDCLRDGCLARVPAREMFGCVATACRRMASAPGDGTTWSFAGWVMERVSRGRVRRVQVQPQRRAAVLRHMRVFCDNILQSAAAANAG